MMRAATYDRTGPAAEVLRMREVATPDPGPGEVLVRVAASGINPADVKRRGGWNGAQMQHPLVIPHSDGAGVIEKLGAGVDPARLGQRVWMWNAQGGYGTAGRAFGTAAEYIALPADQAVLLPETLTFDEGACLGVPALTAWLALMADGPITDQSILVQGAAGAVGQCCVQMALAFGARVIATVSNDAGAHAVAALGDVQVVNRHAEDVATVVRQTTGGVQRIIEVDLAANFATDTACLAPHGVIASYSCSSNPTPLLPYYDLANLGATVRFVQGFLLPRDQRRRAEADIIDLLRTNRLRPAIGARFPLDEIASAHTRVETGSLGQTVLTLNTSEGKHP